jgi:hypothetical protein
MFAGYVVTYRWLRLAIEVVSFMFTSTYVNSIVWLLFARRNACSILPRRFGRVPVPHIPIWHTRHDRIHGNDPHHPGHVQSKHRVLRGTIANFKYQKSLVAAGYAINPCKTFMSLTLPAAISSSPRLTERPTTGLACST